MRRTLRDFEKRYLFTGNDLPLFEIQNIFAVTGLWLEHGMETIEATFDLFVRDLPECRNFFLFGGLEEIVEGILAWNYAPSDRSYLRSIGMITLKTDAYLKHFRFSGDVYAMDEGTPFFGGEPVVRITAPLPQANLFSMFLINAMTSHTLLMSKIIRVRLAAGQKDIVCGGGLRSQSFESGLKSNRAAYLCGSKIGIIAGAKKYGLPSRGISVNIYHAVIKSFSTELEAFRAAAAMYPHHARLMVDTYDFEQGLKNLITVARELKATGNSINALNIDSGDIYKRSVRARTVLDRAGFPDIKIIAASNLDEHRVADLEKRRAPIDMYVAQTEINTIADAPKLEAVYKLAEIKRGRHTLHTAKLTTGKISYPGKKQVFRVFKKGKAITDVIGLENEHHGEPLLKPVIRRGKLVRKHPSLDRIREQILDHISTLPPELKKISRKQISYPVTVSSRLRRLFEEVKKQH